MYWDQINLSYMSEESTHESDGEVVVHKHTPVFRSEGKGMIRLRFEASGNTHSCRPQQANKKIGSTTH